MSADECACLSLLRDAWRVSEKKKKNRDSKGISGRKYNEIAVWM
jgi:hypothetical protein